MKKILSIIIIAAAFGCNQPSTGKTEKKTEAMTPAKNESVNSDLAKLEFASTKDLSCGMPISAGLSDTASYKGKLYGFCSAACKEDFLKDPEAHLAAK